MNVKKLRILCMLSFLSFVFLTTAEPVSASEPIKLFMNGSEQVTDPAPYVDNASGRTYVPLRFITENIGAIVGWNSIENSVGISCPWSDISIKLVIDSKEAYISNGSGQNMIPLDAPPRIVSGRTMIPLRFISENMGLDVSWDASQNMVQITKKL